MKLPDVRVVLAFLFAVPLVAFWLLGREEPPVLLLLAGLSLGYLLGYRASVVADDDPEPVAVPFIPEEVAR